jgi:hypothetical protein
MMPLFTGKQTRARLPPLRTFASTTNRRGVTMMMMMMMMCAGGWQTGGPFFLWPGIIIPRSHGAFLISSDTFSRQRRGRAVVYPLSPGCIPEMLVTMRSVVVRTLAAQPIRKESVVDTYQTVTVRCHTCTTKLFRYKKKNGMKSNLVKCYVERIVEDCENLLSRSASSSSSSPTPPVGGVLAKNKEKNAAAGAPKTKGDEEEEDDDDSNTADPGVPVEYHCPQCRTRFARAATIKGLPALKLVGGKVRMTKK